MRLTDHEQNPILSPCLAWFGGGDPSDGLTPKQRNAKNIYRVFEAIATRPDHIRFPNSPKEKGQTLEPTSPPPPAHIDKNKTINKQVSSRKGIRRSILAAEPSSGYSTLG
jgi:hypothetical protein